MSKLIICRMFSSFHNQRKTASGSDCKGSHWLNAKYPSTADTKADSLDDISLLSCSTKVNTRKQKTEYSEEKPADAAKDANCGMSIQKSP